MEVLPVDILMFEDNVGLVAITHTFHIFLRNVPELIVSQSVFRQRVQRGVEDRIGRPAIGFEVWSETIHANVDIHTTVFIKRL